MSQEKAQLIAPIGIMTVTGLTATGVITASSFTGNIVGSAKSLVNGTDVTAGVVTGTSFVGNLTGNIQRLADSAPNINVGVTTATSFVGNLTGSVTDLTSQPAITVGLVTASSLSGPITGNVTGNVVGNVTGNVTGTIAGNVTGDVTGNATGLAGGLGINYNGGWTGAGTSQVRAGVVTATTFYGDGSNLDGVSGGPVSQQAVTIDGASTSIDLSNGNVIYATQSANTTVSFANTENGNIYFIRTKDNNDTARTITWPDRINWDGGSEPTLISDSSTGDAQIFLLITRDMGVTWYGKEVYSLDVAPQLLFVWGDNSYGELGHNDRTQRSSPIQVSGNNWSPIKTNNIGGSNEIVAKKTDNTLWCWGRGAYGQLGLNAVTAVSSPTQIGTDTNWALNCGGAAVIGATKTDGTLWMWGFNARGAMGQNNAAPGPGDLYATSLSSPTQIPGTTWPISTTGADNVNMAIGYSPHVIKQDGTLWSWGNNENGNLGQNTSNEGVSSPTQVGTDTTWKCVTDGMSKFTLGTKTDGTLWAWGSDGSGALGQNGPVNRRLSSPTQIGSGTDWARVSQNNKDDFVGAIKTNGTLWMWSKGDRGLTAQNDLVWRSSPTQVGTGNDWKAVTIGDNHAIAVKTDGTLWGWGNNQSAELGQNSKTPDNFSSPVQITGTTWNTISATSTNNSIATQPYTG